MLASRRPANAVGWLFVAFGLIGCGLGFFGTMAEFALSAGGRTGLASAAAWSEAVLSSLVVPALVLVFLLFPDGRVPGRRWRALLWLTGAETVAIALTQALRPGPLDGLPALRNPLGVESAAGAIDLVVNTTYVAAPVLLVAAAASLVVRFRRASGRERQQLKWFASGGALSAVLFGGTLLTSASDTLRDSERLTAVTDVLVAVAFLALPISAGVAILRHRLYDIDVLINRTLVYGALTATLGLTYAGAVILLGQVFRPLTSGSDLAIAGSTLAVAGLFGPARSRIQSVVDRRFFRPRYDAQRTVEAFSARLRDEVDLAALSRELQAVVGKTMQPAHVSLWLRRPPRTTDAAQRHDVSA